MKWTKSESASCCCGGREQCNVHPPHGSGEITLSRGVILHGMFVGLHCCLCVCVCACPLRLSSLPDPTAELPIDDGKGSS